ncbi:MAG: hypothetical protein ACTSVY_11315 [Candidatus Helarchaeota archaeon]
MEDNRFEDMINRIIEESNLEIAGGKLTNVLKNEVERVPDRKKNFVTKYNETWKKFKARYGKHMVSPFLEWAGSSIIKNFLWYVFSFKEEQILPTCTKGKSNVDALLCVDYVFTKEDLELIKNKLETNAIGIEPKEAAKMILSNAMKVLPKVLNDILEISYRLFTSSVELEELPNQDGLKISLKYDGRIG